MIDKFCDWLTNKIKEKVTDIDEEKELVINFGIRLIFGELPKILVLFIIGFLLNIGWYTLLLFTLIAPYRSFTGGFHLKTHTGCMITTSILYLAPIIIAKNVQVKQPIILYTLAVLIAIFSIIIIAKYAPADTENMPILSKKERKSKKTKAYVTLIILLGIILLNPNYIVSYMLIFGVLLQNLTVLPISYKLTNSKYGYQVYTEETT
ncbi:MAG: accessory gene regulator ArgB-like protein [Clostridia bacterium]